MLYALNQQQLPLDTQQLGKTPALFITFRALKRFVDRYHRLAYSPGSHKPFNAAASPDLALAIRQIDGNRSRCEPCAG